jgi:DnaJ-class molecular chaperone
MSGNITDEPEESWVHHAVDAAGWAPKWRQRRELLSLDSVTTCPACDGVGDCPGCAGLVYIQNDCQECAGLDLCWKCGGFGELPDSEQPTESSASS